VGLYFAWREGKGTDEYFLAGGKMGWWAIAASLFLSNFFRFQVLMYSISISRYFWLTLIIAGLISLFVLVGQSRFGWTLTSFAMIRNTQLSLSFSVLLILFYAVVQVLSVLFLAGFVFEDLMHIEYYTATMIIVVFTGIYVVVGGFGAVMRTQTVQFVLFAVGVLVILISGVHPVWILHPNLIHTMNNFPQSSALTSAFIGAPLLGLWMWNIDHQSAQQLFSVRNTRQRVIGFAVALLGVSLALLFLISEGNKSAPAAELPVQAALSGESILQTIAGKCVILGFFAIIVSTLATSFTSVAWLFTHRLYVHFQPSTTEIERVFIARLATTAACVIAILLIPIGKMIGGSAILYFFLIPAYFCPPVAALVIINLLWKNGSSFGEIVALISGEVTAFLLFLLNQLSATDLVKQGPFAFLPADPFINAIGLFFLTGIIYMSVGYVRTQKVGVADSPQPPDRKLFHAAQAERGTRTTRSTSNKI
jgi:SSS family solute:Na+ symporter